MHRIALVVAFLAALAAPAFAQKAEQAVGADPLPGALRTRLGVRIGDFVAILCLDQAEWVAAYFGTVNIDLLRDGDPRFVQHLADHAFNNGAFTWTIPLDQPQVSDYRIRIHANDGIMPETTTPQTFLVTNNGHDYYLNDSSTEGDVFTQVEGNDGNSGKNYAVTFVQDTTGAITPQASGNNTAKISLDVGATSAFAASSGKVAVALKSAIDLKCTSASSSDIKPKFKLSGGCAGIVNRTGALASGRMS